MITKSDGGTGGDYRMLAGWERILAGRFFCPEQFHLIKQNILRRAIDKCT